MLSEDLELAHAHNRQRAEARIFESDKGLAVERADRELDEARQALEAARGRVERAEEELDAATERHTEASGEFEAMGPEIDTGALQRKIHDGSQLNESIARAHEFKSRRAVLLEQAKEARTGAAALTRRMDDRILALKRAIEEADLPVEGLTLDRGMVLYRGMPFPQASDAEKLRVSCAISMRQNAKLRILLIRDGSLLDDDSLALLASMAEEEEYQCWIERVDTSGRIGVYIEEGEVVAVGEPLTGDGTGEALPLLEEGAGDRVAPGVVE